MSIKDFIAKKLNIKSPSREFVAVGPYISIGFRLGIMDTKLKRVYYKRPFEVRPYRYTEPYKVPDNALTYWRFMTEDYL